MDDLPTALATSLGMSGTRTTSGAASGTVSSSRTPPWASASTKAVCGNVTARISGFTYSRSPATASSSRRLGSRNVRSEPGPANTASVRAWCRQNSSSSSRSAKASSSAARSCLSASASWSRAARTRFLNAIRSAAPDDAGSVGT